MSHLVTGDLENNFVQGKSRNQGVMADIAFGSTKSTKDVLNEPECLKTRAEREVLLESQNFKSRTIQVQEARGSVTAVTKTTCRFFSMPSGCVHGENCHYAHEGEDRSRKQNCTGSWKSNRGVLPSSKHTENVSKSKKIFVSGLPSIAESDDLYQFFEEKFGSVLDAIVIPAHSDDQSRRFGIVTFKSEESFSAASQAHHVYIFGKKVDVQVVYGRAAISGSTAARKDFMTSRTESTKSSDLPCRRLFGENDQPPKLTPSQIAISSRQSKSSSSPIWAQKFKEWLPKFLAEVSKRLGEGALYPLCSLKGDFRATCGMELDHVSLGYEKLSDFIRSMPEICNVTVAPVGTGPATHIVLEKVPSVQTTTGMTNGPVADSGRSLADSSERNEIATGSGNGSGNNRSAISTKDTPTMNANLQNALIRNVSLVNINSSSSEQSPILSSMRLFPPTDSVSVLPLFYIGPNVFAKLPAVALQPFIPQQESLFSHNMRMGSDADVEACHALQSCPASPQSSACASTLADPEQALPANYPESPCMNCLEQAAFWVAVPCGHRGLCTSCKDALQNCGAWGSQCLVCQGYVERWTALL